MGFSSFRLGCLWLVVACAHAATLEERVELLFRPPLAEHLALSTDGRFVAYTQHVGNELQVILLNVNAPRQKTPVSVADAQPLAFSKDKQRAQLRFLRWATADRLVIAPTEDRVTFPDNQGSKVIAPIFAVDATGANPRVLVEADEFAVARDGPPEAVPVYDGRTPQIVGFEPGQRDQLVLRLPGMGRTTPPELVLLNVHTGKLTGLHPDEVRGTNDGRLRVDPGLRREVEADLARKFPRRHVAVMDWSEGMQHVLVRVTGGSDPGRVFVYQRPVNLVVEIFRTAPWLKADTLHETRFIEAEVQPGVRLSGYLTWPRVARLKPPPLLVFFPSGFPGRPPPDFDPEAQVFADLGLAVLRLDHRYTRALPAAERELARTAIDRVSVDDAAAMIRAVAAQVPDRPVDLKHVAALGHGFGGYLAVRALQLRPEVFRAGIAIDAPMDLRPWLNPIEGPRARDIPSDVFSGEGVAWAKLSVRDNLDALKRPVFLLAEPGRNVAVDSTVDAVRSRLKALRRPAEYLALDPGFNLGLPLARATVYRKIEEFLNLQLYDYRVKIGPATEVK